MIRTLPLYAALCLSVGTAAAQEATDFESPQAALESLIDALSSGSAAALIAVLGPEAEGMVRPDDSDERAADWKELVDGYNEGYRLVPQGADRVEIELGRDDWPFPIPLDRGETGWSFNVADGLAEIRRREVGQNELGMIEVLNAYVEIQRDFRLTDHDGDGVLEFAAQLISSEGARDGLYWPGEDSPVGDLAARASFEGFASDGEDTGPEPLLGYYLRMLNAQGPNAPGGEMEYIINGNQVAGHAMLAIPAEYGVTGIMTFMVAENGVVLEADLGDSTLEIAEDLTSYNPTELWKVAE